VETLRLPVRAPGLYPDLRRIHFEMVGDPDRCDKVFDLGRMGHRRGELEKPRASGLGPPRSTRTSNRSRSERATLIREKSRQRTTDQQARRRCLSSDPFNPSASRNADAKAGRLASFEWATPCVTNSEIPGLNGLSSRLSHLIRQDPDRFVELILEQWKQSSDKDPSAKKLRNDS